MTHVCFLFYHVTSNITLRRLQHFAADFPERVQWIIRAAWILALSYFIAYLETIAISNVCSKNALLVISAIIIFMVHIHDVLSSKRNFEMQEPKCFTLICLRIF